MTNGTATQTEIVTIKPANFAYASMAIIGDAPYLMCRFSQKAMDAIHATHQAGSTAKSKKTRDARDFQADYQGAFHRSKDGWAGIPAASIRNASIDACRMAGYVMTRGKMSIFVEADGFDAIDGVPLIRINGEPEYTEMAVRNAMGKVDLRPRPMWRTWDASLKIRYDADQFTHSDVVNLINRAGMQVGIGEGRPFSKSSNGMGFGLFHVATVADEMRKVI